MWFFFFFFNDNCYWFTWYTRSSTKFHWVCYLKVGFTLDSVQCWRNEGISWKRLRNSRSNSDIWHLSFFGLNSLLPCLGDLLFILLNFSITSTVYTVRCFSVLRTHTHAHANTQKYSSSPMPPSIVSTDAKNSFSCPWRIRSLQHISQPSCLQGLKGSLIDFLFLTCLKKKLILVLICLLWFAFFFFQMLSCI